MPKPSSKPPKVALVCDWLTEVGGAERVLLALHQIYPNAPIYTSQYRKNRINWFNQAKVHTGYLNFLPAKFRRFIGPLRQLYFNKLDLSDYDIIISVTGAEAKSIQAKSATHFCYCHVPTQYYWGKYEEYLENPGFGPLDPLARTLLKTFIRPLRSADYKSAQKPDYFITISNYAANQIKKYYNREAEIIYPPVDTSFFHNQVENNKTKKGVSQTAPSPNYSIDYVKSQVNLIINKYNKNSKNQINIPEQDLNDFCTAVENSHGFFINFSRQVTWKRLDLIVESCKKVNQPAIIIGEGPEHKSLQKLAKDSHVLLLPRLGHQDLKTLLNLAKAFIFPSHEPFGIAPVEALSAGCPVIAYNQGGSKDFITPGKNGLFFFAQSVKSLSKALLDFESQRKNLLLKPDIQHSADQFSLESFKKNITKFIHEKTKSI